MVREEVVAYLQEHGKKFKLADLRAQLAAEGVGEADFNDSLKAAQAVEKSARRARMGRLLMAVGILSSAGGGLMFLQSRKPPPAPAPVVSSDRGFVGRAGYVLRLPDGYAAVQSSDPEDSRIEIVHFCKAGADPTTFVDTGLFGPMGIVRLDVRPNPFGTGPDGLSRLSQYTASLAQRGGEKYAVKNVQVSSLPGLQLTFEAPNARVETYIIGQHSLYRFYAGQDDEVLRDLVNSLRDTQEE